ncbi:protein arginine N-methyltransferase 9 [Parasteatoda tepidariorum]|uniref:protein arginine N-methyltransferase 9 n=1 Tax=Parasteatoda tepidariorum TaxID=114398 RepID=UPI00077F9070|nr:protein arginine N-methyltransferase 9 [Parasteatoda tepidariorum]
METDSWSEGRQLLLQRCKSRAIKCLKEHEYSRAFAHFIVALTVEPSVKGELLNAFLFTLEKVAGDLEKNKQVNEVIMCYEQALEVLPNDSHVLHGLATTLFRLGYVECSLSYFLKSYEANPFFTPSLYCMENLKNALVERWHFVMLNDSVRNNAYKHAIKRAVEKGYNQVLDIGAGTGILSMMAVDTGAEKVYACEGSEILFEVLQSVIKMNNKPIEAFLKHSTDLNIPDDIPERVNLIVTEIFDAGLFGENSLETLSHAWKHLLQEECNSTSDMSPSDVVEGNLNKNQANSESPKEELIPRVKIIPHSATVYAVPVECEKFRKNFKLEDAVLNMLGIKDCVIPQFLDEEPYSTEKIKYLSENCKMLSEPAPIVEANFNSYQSIKELLQGKLLNPEFKCTKNGNVDAFVVWFDLYLDEEEMISSSPRDSSQECCWEQAIFYALPQYINGSSHCYIGDNIQAEFLCKGHLQLKNIKIAEGVVSMQSDQRLTMDPNLIYLLNSYMAGDIINFNLSDMSNMDNAEILDISTFPVVGLKSLINNPSYTLTVLKSPFQSEVEQICALHGIPYNKVVFKSYEDFFRTKLQSDFLIVDPVEISGLLKKNVLEDISVMRLQCLKSTGVVVPGELELHAILVESETLKEYSKLVSDEKVAGYKISQVINAYQCRIHQDIQLSTLPHRSLSQPTKLHQINMNSTENGSKSSIIESQKTTEVEITEDGKITAIVYWFGLKYHSGIYVNTSDPNGLFKQAACLLEDDVCVKKGEKICLQWSLKNSCLQIGVYDNETTVLK